MADPFNEKTLLDSICSFLTNITGLNAQPYPTSNLITPLAIPMLAPEYSARWSGDGDVALPVMGRILVLVKPGVGTSGNTDLSDYISGAGSRSIHAAVCADRTLGGAVSDCRVIGPTEDMYQRFDADGNLVLFGRYLRIEVYP